MNEIYQIQISHITSSDINKKRIHLWSLDKIEEHIKHAFCELCSTPGCCRFCLFTHLMVDLKDIEDRTSENTK